jgi:hypothetical protein
VLHRQQLLKVRAKDDPIGEDMLTGLPVSICMWCLVRNLKGGANSGLINLASPGGSSFRTEKLAFSFHAQLHRP